MYAYNTQVRYSELAMDGKIKIESLVDLMQSTSSSESEEVGVSFEKLMSLGQVWVLNSWQIIFERRPRQGEKIKVSTWAYDNQEIFGYRNYLIEDEKGRKCAYANTVWVMTDPETSRPKKVIPEAYKGYGAHPRIEMDYEDRKIKLPGKTQQIDTFPVRKRHIDTLLHVNNVRYIEMAMEYIPENLNWNQLRVQYLKSAKLGDNLYIGILEDKKAFYVAIEDENAKPYALIEVKEVMSKERKDD